MSEPTNSFLSRVDAFEAFTKAFEGSLTLTTSGRRELADMLFCYLKICRMMSDFLSPAVREREQGHRLCHIQMWIDLLEKEGEEKG